MAITFFSEEKEMKRHLLVALLVLVAAVTISSAAIAAQPSDTVTTTKLAMDFHDGMRRLWSDHVIYTRCYIISALADLPDAGPTAERLLKNQDEIGNAIKPYYGDAAGTKLTELLRSHIVIATEVLAAAKAGDKDALAKSQAKWIANADEIAAFLAAANPNWSFEVLKDALRMHLDLTTAEVTSRLAKDWPKDIASFDAGYTHMLGVADVLSGGIVKQFPDKFK